MDTREQMTEATDAAEPGPGGAAGWPAQGGEDDEDFSRALDQWEAGLKSLKEGDVVQGRVIKILDKEVIVDIGYKSEGVVDIDEFRSPDGTISVKEGDRLEVLLEKRPWLVPGDAPSIADSAVVALLDEVILTSRFGDRLRAYRKIDAWIGLCP